MLDSHIDVNIVTVRSQVVSVTLHNLKEDIKLWLQLKISD